MKQLYLYVTDGKYNYGMCKIKNDCVIGTPNNSKILYAGKEIEVDSAFWYYLYKELIVSTVYRTHFIYHWTQNFENYLIICLLSTKYNLIDYNWNERVYELVKERCELEHALSWLSTLGGAFSALGDYFQECAETAGKISFHQLKLAIRLGDPSIASRCRLYLSLSLIQKKQYKYARRIIESEYKHAIKSRIIDPRLLNMCKGIWSKLQYEYYIYKKVKNKYN